MPYFPLPKRQTSQCSCFKCTGSLIIEWLLWIMSVFGLGFAIHGFAPVTDQQTQTHRVKNSTSAALRHKISVKSCLFSKSLKAGFVINDRDHTTMEIPSDPVEITHTRIAMLIHSGYCMIRGDLNVQNI